MEMWSPFLLKVLSFLMPVLLLLAWTFQSLGYTDTCTQGDTGAYLAGTVLSLPLMMTVFGFLLWDHRFKKYSKGATLLVVYFVCAVIFAAIAATNLPLADSVLMAGFSACGSEYSDPNTATREDYLIAISYAVAPLLLAACTFYLVVSRLFNKKDAPADDRA